MNSLQEIEAVIMQLFEDEMRKSNWLQEYLDDVWDRQIEADAKSGRLERLIELSNTDIAANRVTLDKVLNDT